MDIHTERLILRPWSKEDFEPFAALNADPRVMEYFPATLSREESDALAARILQGIETQGVAPFIICKGARSRSRGGRYKAADPAHAV